jgi:hypothetical protein
MEHPLSSLSLPQLVSIVGVITALALLKGFKKKGEQETHFQS